MKTVYLICGVPGSGKTWVCEQLKDKYEYVPHDLYMHNLHHILLDRSETAKKPMITECPFAEREFKQKLELRGLSVIPYFIVEPQEVVKTRYESRGKPLPKNIWTRALTIRDRAIEWNCPHGTSLEILDKLTAQD